MGVGDGVVVGDVNDTETRVTGLTPGVLYTFSVSSENDVSSQDNNINDRSATITIRTREGGLYIHSMSMHGRCKKILQDCFTVAAEPCELYNIQWVNGLPLKVLIDNTLPGYKPCVYLAIVWLVLLYVFRYTNSKDYCSSMQYFPSHYKNNILR